MTPETQAAFDHAIAEAHAKVAAAITLSPDDAIVSGIIHAKHLDLTKPYDVAVCIRIALAAEGYRITRIPARKPQG